MTILILGGTSEGNALARALAGRDVATSFAGRTGHVPDLPGCVRVGGFGGAEGLEAYLRAEGISAVVDATHPFAARITANAARACARAGVRRLMLVRPMWERVAGDRWVEVDSMEEAARRLPDVGRRAFLTVGIQEAAAFAGLRVHLVVRLLQPEPLPLADYAVVAGKGPFTEADDTRLLRDHAIDVVVTKASGGAATYPKIAAARALGLPVLMVRRPDLPEGERVSSVEDAVEWLRALSSSPRTSEA